MSYTLAKVAVAQKTARALASAGAALGQAIDFTQGLMDQTRADRANAWSVDNLPASGCVLTVLAV